MILELFIWYSNSPFWSSYKDQHFDQVQYWQIKANFCKNNSASGRNRKVSFSWELIQPKRWHTSWLTHHSCVRIRILSAILWTNGAVRNFLKFSNRSNISFTDVCVFSIFEKSSFIFIISQLLPASVDSGRYDNCLTKFDRSQKNHWRMV